MVIHRINFILVCLVCRYHKLDFRSKMFLFSYSKNYLVFEWFPSVTETLGRSPLGIISQSSSTKICKITY